VVQSVKQMTRAVRGCKGDVIEYLGSEECTLLGADLHVSEAQLDVLLAAGATVSNTLGCLRDLNRAEDRCASLQELSEKVRAQKLKPLEYLRGPDCTVLVPAAPSDKLAELASVSQALLASSTCLERDLDDMIQRMGSSQAVLERLREMTRDDLYVPSIAHLHDALPMRQITYPKSHSNMYVLHVCVCIRMCACVCVRMWVLTYSPFLSMHLRTCVFGCVQGPYYLLQRRRCYHEPL
jgi:hypothetical protein